ncbi:MAG: hypothetical protein CMK24_07595 [Porticoccaceae bacterium]|mgnify:CR=1 FL=1|nr:hypothetical protein [Porticoccaceae bacterium]|tara:strand:+ start:894 stop:1886 length:993 start_codon:yes stop_codon:yes gene_type:complete
MSDKTTENEQHKTRFGQIISENVALSAAEQRRIDDEMKRMNDNIAREVERRSRSRFTGIDPTSDRYRGRRNEAGVRSNPNFDPTAPGAQDAIRRAQVRDNFAKGRAPKYGDPTHPSRTGTRGSTYSFGARSQGGFNVDREKAIQDILKSAPEGSDEHTRLMGLDGASLQSEIDNRISANNKAQMDRIKADREYKEMEQFGYQPSNAAGGGPPDPASTQKYRDRSQEYRAGQRAAFADYKFGDAGDGMSQRDIFNRDIDDLRSQRSSAGSREERIAINAKIRARQRQDSIARRNMRRAAAGGKSRAEFMQNENHFPTSPSEFVKMLREQSN